MQVRAFRWSLAVCGLPVLAILSSLVPPAWAGQDKKSMPKPLPEKTVQAWKNAGAKFGWLRAERDGFWKFFEVADGVPGDLPAFLIYPFRKGLLPKLPAPAEPFGLLIGGEVTD